MNRFVPGRSLPWIRNAHGVPLTHNAAFDRCSAARRKTDAELDMVVFMAGEDVSLAYWLQRKFGE